MAQIFPSWGYNMTHFQSPLFVSHGAPDLVMSDTPASRFLQDLYRGKVHPDGILIMSAHWRTRELTITTSSHLSTMHDFGGFSRELHEISYPARTSPSLIADIIGLLTEAKMSFQTDNSRGLDHGAWAPLYLMFPDTPVPVVQVSIPYSFSNNQLFELGKILSPLPQSNILICGSSASVHNLRHLTREGAEAPDWAKQFDEWINNVVKEGDWNALCRFESHKLSSLAHPTPEHFLPLIFIAGAGQVSGRLTKPMRLHYSYSYGSIGMSSWEFC